ncbi:DUF1294 domain-containing protein [Blautia sp. XA-2221]|uniref:DUF1294 domain-containing protein n=1 Tax=Blautia sp. XA-2221 TaxID=2903961 RepID=UPI00237886EB|nr:DUF1294 domain-containing protein [Blautia sp. XA-2221]
MYRYFVLYLIFINMIAFLAYGIDKKRAVRNQWRISEKALLGMAALGGSIGALAGMKIFHHKTRKAKFFVGVPVILAAELIVGFWVLVSIR